MIYAKVIEDSINPHGHRLTTMEVRMHRFVLAEFNTHRVFSRNSASSRAIPISKMIERVRTDPAIPIEFGTNQKGMQAGEPITGEQHETAVRLWKSYANEACDKAAELADLGVHKQIVNRILEPYMWHTVIVSSTEWGNFFEQRCSPLAQPEINAVAQVMRTAISESKPVLKRYYHWHTPYISDEEKLLPLRKRLKISAARCARVSYLTHDGKRDIEKDIELFDKLATANPPHWSPMEHVACPYEGYGERNFRGWTQLRWFSEENSIDLIEEEEMNG